MLKDIKIGVEASGEKKSVLLKLFGSFLIAAALFAVLLGVERNLLNDYEKASAVICKTDVPKGMKITKSNVKQYFESYDVDAILVDDTCVKVPKDLVGTVVARKLAAQEIVRKDDCSKEAKVYQKFQEPVLGSFMANAAGDVVSGTIRRGDYINIGVINKDTLEYDIMLEKVYVEDAFTNAGKAVTAEEEGTAATMLTIVEEKENLMLFYRALKMGSVVVTKVKAE